MKYRREIDGLRAIAVVPVVLFHAGFEVFSGGFVGVDVFFVISGYLITNIIIDEMNEGKFCLLDFYERRARRILPALFVVVLCCIPFAWFLLLPSDMRDFSQSLVAVATFSSNILFWRESGYFDTASELKPLLHTWSLAVEEQFYILFPLILMVAWRLGKRAIVSTLAAAFVISLATAHWGAYNKPDATFYLLHTRAWELLIGSFAAFYSQHRSLGTAAWVNNALSTVGLAAILYGVFAFDDVTPFPSLYALIPTVGTVLIILFAVRGTAVHQLLSMREFAGVGLISYSLYLWHQPVFAFWRHYNFYEPSHLQMAIISLACLPLAYLTYRLVEVPFRKPNKAKDDQYSISQRSIFLLSTIGLFAFASLGISGYFFNRTIDFLRFNSDPQYVETYLALEEARSTSSVYFAQNRFDNGDCRFSAPNLTSSIVSRLAWCHETFGSGILVFGDSHATNLFHSIVRNEQYDDVEFVVGISKNGCHLPAISPDCHYDEIIHYLSDNPEIFSRFVYEKAGHLMLDFVGRRADLRRTDADVAQVNEEIVQGVIEYLSSLSQFGSVLWFGPRIEPMVGERELFRLTCNGEFNIPENLSNSFALLDDYLQQVVPPNISYISQIDAFDFSFPRDFGDCDGLFWADFNHFSAVGEREFGSRYNILR